MKLANLFYSMLQLESYKTEGKTEVKARSSFIDFFEDSQGIRQFYFSF